MQRGDILWGRHLLTFSCFIIFIEKKLVKEFRKENYGKYLPKMKELVDKKMK